MGNLTLSEQSFQEPSLSIPNAWCYTVHSREACPVDSGFFVGLCTHGDDTGDLLAPCDGMSVAELNRKILARNAEMGNRARRQLSVIRASLGLMVSVSLLPQECVELVYATATSQTEHECDHEDEDENDSGDSTRPVDKIGSLPAVIIRRADTRQAAVIFCTTQATRISYEKVIVCSPCRCHVSSPERTNL